MEQIDSEMNLGFFHELFRLVLNLLRQSTLVIKTIINTFPECMLGRVAGIYSSLIAITGLLRVHNDG